VEETPLDRLLEGAPLLAPVLTPLGYRMAEPVVGKGSDGPLARATWSRDRQYIQTHVRGALGIVLYGCSAASFLHQEYLRWRGLNGAYPGSATTRGTGSGTWSRTGPGLPQECLRCQMRSSLRLRQASTPWQHPACPSK